MSCCPPNAEKYLANTYENVGKCQELSSGLEYYSTGKFDSKKAILVIPDVYGWNGGRTRSIADLLANEDYYVMIPKLLTPALEGGTDGDGLSSDFSFATDGAKFAAYFGQTHTFPILQPKLQDCINYLHCNRIEKIGILSFCFGGWIASHVLSTDMSLSIQCAVIAHPSITLEERVYGQNTFELIKKVQKPLLLMPCKGDPDEYRIGGIYYEELKSRLPSTDSYSFDDENHGFWPRGDATNETTKAAIQLATTKTIDYFNAHF